MLLKPKNVDARFFKPRIITVVTAGLLLCTSTAYICDRRELASSVHGRANSA